jgi:hypothetical protein
VRAQRVDNSVTKTPDGIVGSRREPKVKYRVHYPTCHDDQYRDFLTRAQAEKFARERQKILDLSPAYLTINSWRTIWIEEIK